MLDGIKSYFSLHPLNGYRFIFYICYAKAFLVRFLNPKSFLTVGKYLSTDIVVSWNGLKLYARGHSEDLGYYARTVKRDTSRWFKPEKNQVVVDCGASVGIFSLIALQKGSTVYSFEPNPETFDVLRKNVEVNGFSAHLFKMGLSNRPGFLILYAPKNFTGTASFNKQWSLGEREMEDEIVEKKVQVTTLDDQLAELQKIDWLLIDVESFELELLKGSEKTLNKVNRIIIEVSHSHREEVLSLITEFGFTAIDQGTPDGGVQYFFFERI